MQFIATVRDHESLQRKVLHTYTLFYVTVGCYNFMWHMGFLHLLNLMLLSIYLVIKTIDQNKTKLMFDDTVQQGLIWNTSTYLEACKHSGKGVLLLLLLD